MKQEGFIHEAFGWYRKGNERQQTGEGHDSETYWKWERGHREITDKREVENQ